MDVKIWVNDGGNIRPATYEEVFSVLVGSDTPIRTKLAVSLPDPDGAEVLSLFNLSEAFGPRGTLE